MNHNIWTHADTVYQQGDIVLYKRAGNVGQKRPGAATGTDGQQILLKHGSFYTRVHLSNLQ